MSRPAHEAGESVAAYLKRLDAWREQGDWTPASGGTEVPFTTQTGARLLYCYQPRSGRHAYLDVHADIILTDEEARQRLGTY